VKKNAKQGLYTAFKVIEIGTNRKPVCDFLLVINSNWHPISYRFGVIAAYCSNFGHFAFLSHPLWGLGTTFDFLLVLNEVFSVGVTAESLRAKRSKIGDFTPTGASWSNISCRRGRPHQPFFFSEN